MTVVDYVEVLSVIYEDGSAHPLYGPVVGIERLPRMDAGCIRCGWHGPVSALFEQSEAS